jgi:hypothetical protein
MAQTTAVNWLLEQIENKNGKEFTSYYTEFIEKAKAMEKEQHGSTWDEAIYTHERRGHVIARSIVDFDYYYNETYNK